jgi:hypothetical protein
MSVQQRVANWFFLNEGTVEDCSKAIGEPKQVVEGVVIKNQPKWVAEEYITIEPCANSGFKYIPTKKWVDWACSKKQNVYEVRRILARHQMAHSEAAAGSSVPTVLHVTVSCPGCARAYPVTLPSITEADTLFCDACRIRFRAQKGNGYVYVLSNSKMPGLVKIGRTNQVDQRARELSRQTGVPTDFAVEAKFASHAPEEHESEIKRRLHSKRIVGKEFFEMDLGEAIRIVQAVVGTDPINPSDDSLTLMLHNGGPGTA